jgi:hypothetical protein
MQAVVVMKNQKLAIILSVLVLGLSGSAKAATPVAPPAPAQSTPSSTSGKMTAYTAGTHGELDGFILDNGTTVHFPAHVGFKVRPLLRMGQALSVEGTVQPGPGGQQVLEASNIKNTTTGKSVNVAMILPAGALPPGAVSPPGMPSINEAPSS